MVTNVRSYLRSRQRKPHIVKQYFQEKHVRYAATLNANYLLLSVIAIKGEPGISLFKEYYKNPEATAKDLVGSWFYSGDYGKVDEEGYVYFMDRKKDVIQRAAENISAPEVERVLNDHPAVEESAVIAVPDPVRDEAVMAVIRFKQGASATEEELTEFCRKRMAKFKVPQFYVFQKEDFLRHPLGRSERILCAQRY